MSKVLCVDPGEDTGWATFDAETGDFIDAGTAKLWEFADALFSAVFSPREEIEFVEDELALSLIGVSQIVCEDFRIYPWEAKKGSLNWDPVRTARLIGALTIIAKRGAIPFKLQGAKIKERAEAAGAAVLFMAPLHENRHANDAIRHGVYFFAVERGSVPVEHHEDEEPQDATSH